MRPANPSFGLPPEIWTQRREASLNWLALGLLLAAWNAVDDPGSAGLAESPQPALRPRPALLRAHSYVTVRSLTRAAAVEP
jgi:hypothetical protein